MLFSSPDYPLFLIAVFFLYGLARWGEGVRGAIGRIALMTVLGDIVFALVAKDPAAVWDPIGGVLLQLVAPDDDVWRSVANGVHDALGDGVRVARADRWTAWLLVKWAIGAGVLAGAITAGRRHATWIASERGQRAIGIGFVAGLVALGTTVGVAESAGALDAVTRHIVAHAHLAVLATLGVGFGIGLAGAEDGTRRPLGRVITLFVASSLFYHAWAAAMPGPYRYLLALLLATIVLDYYLGIWIEGTEDPWRRKLLVIVSLCSNLGILVFFKYSDFFRLDVLHLDAEPWGLILPAGISFHTFQSLSYTIDVYRRELPATRSVVEFATFVLFFPQLVAGPIVRAQDLLPQLRDPPAFELRQATLGLHRIVVGLFKKIALADALAISIVDRVFEAPERFSSLEVLCGVYGYALQIYLDFSAYSDIAIGSAQLLGFAMPENFRTPYRSSNLQEFWRRWHISLSTWLRDYLYITLGGNKGTAARTYFNLIATMVLGGLWHGASWAFIVWGALHGFGLAITRYFQRATAVSAAQAWRLLAVCAAIAGLGSGVQLVLLGDQGVWTQLVLAWLFLTPLWAVLTAWLGRDDAPAPSREAPEAAEGGPWRPLWTRTKDVVGGGVQGSWRVAEALRLATCVAGIGVFALLQYGPKAWWIPSILGTWFLSLAADVEERGVRKGMMLRVYAVVASAVGFAAGVPGVPSWVWLVVAAAAWTFAQAAQKPGRFGARLLAEARRTISTVLVFHYVCFAWVFFRAESFDKALAVLRELAELDTGSANLGPLVTTALVAGFACHFFADGTFRWLRDRFLALPSWGQGIVLAAAALALRELAHPKLVPFIYFQF
ncbi:MAG: MBOAT family protein [Deltaproteobacteria bacterium]|nr:MBOAT family protein [Deltaproteobacteria bacterium]